MVSQVQNISLCQLLPFRAHQVDNRTQFPKVKLICMLFSVLVLSHFEIIIASYLAQHFGICYLL